jgi:hypothetical protein
VVAGHLTAGLVVTVAGLTVYSVPAEFSTSNEREALDGFLDQQRSALVRKIRGVSDVDARRVPTASSLSLLGLLKHSAVWEQRWFQGVVAGRPLLDGWPQRESKIPDEDFLVDDGDTVELWMDRYEAAAAMSRHIAGAMELEDPCARTDIIDCNLRWVLLHMIEETARHAGHADIIRETLDGTRGM